MIRSLTSSQIRHTRVLSSFALSCTLVIGGCGGGQNSDTPSQAATVNEGRSSSLAAGNVAKASGLSAMTVVASDIVLRAASNQIAGTGAMLQLRYNGVVIASGEVRWTALSDLVFRVPVVMDGGMLDIVFGNAEAADGSPIRQLTIASVTVNGTALSPTAPGVTYDVGYGMNAFDGVQVRAGSNLMVSTGALRIPLPAASQLGAAATVDPASLSPEPGPYVDAMGGSDSYSGTYDRPFKTLARLLQNAVPLMTGENIHLRCGRIWRESLSLGVSLLVDGTKVLPYGTDCPSMGRPVITGADSFANGWTKTGNVWSRSLPPGTPKITHLVLNDSTLRRAQWPNADAPQALVSTSSALAGFRMSAADAAALAGRDVSNATLMLRTQPWKVEQRTVAANGFNGDQITVDGSLEAPVEPGTGWVLRDKAWMLDAPGEFFHDEAAQRLYLIADAAQSQIDVNTARVEGNVRDVVLELRGRRNLTVAGLGLRGSRGDALRFTDSPQALASGLEVRENDAAGIRMAQWETLADTVPGPRVESSYVAANGEYGIDATYVRGAVISGNQVLDTGTKATAGAVMAGIAVGSAGQVLDNIVSGTGYVGIRFSTAAGGAVARNEVRDYCLRLSDCGAIYTWSDGSATGTQSTVVEGNRVFNARANSFGSPDGGNDVVAGVYLDDLSHQVTVRDNFLYGMPMGILLHNASNNTVQNNKVWIASEVGIWVSMDHLDRDQSVGNVIGGNEIVPMTTASAVWPAAPTFKIAHPIWFTHALSGVGALGAGRNEFVANRVVQIHGELAEHAKLSGPAGQWFVDAASWVQLNPAEVMPVRPVTFSTYYVSLGPELVPGGEFTGGLGNWGKSWNWPLVSYDVQPVSSQTGCNGPCVRMTVSQVGDLIYSPGFSMRPGVPHVYRWTAMSPNADAVVADPNISLAVSPWSKMNDSTGFSTLTSRHLKAGKVQQLEAFFVPISASTARVNMQLETPNTPVYLDGISIREVTGWWFSGPPEWMSIVIADRGVDRTVTACGEIGWPAGCQILDAAGQPQPLPFTVPAGSQRMVFWGDSPYRR